MAPWRVIQVPLMISSSKLRLSWSLLSRSFKKFWRFLLYIRVASSGMVAGKAELPIMVTPSTTTVLLSTVPSQFPPFTDARSTTTAPGFICLSMALVINKGALLPGIKAVVMTTSDLTMDFSSISDCFFLYSSDCSTAYPPAPLSSTAPGTSTNLPPRLCTCSFTEALVSNASTTAPKRRDVAIACNPATPAPITSTFAGGTVPAAVINIGKKRGRVAAAKSAALYAETVLMMESTYVLWALAVLGLVCILARVIPCCDVAAINARDSRG